MANAIVEIQFADREPVGPYRLTVAAGRVRHVRVNDLIFPEAIPLEIPYAAVLRSDVPIVVQFSRQDTGRLARAVAGPMAFAGVRGHRARRKEEITTPDTLDTIGCTRWAIADGYIPGWSNGPAPEMTSHEAVCMLNAGDQDAHIEMTVFFADREPAGPYRLTVPARRTRHARLNELTDPEPIPTATPYACVIEADAPIVVQHTRLDSRQAENALLSTIAFSADR